MSQTRRNWIHSLLGAVSVCAFWQHSTKGQGRNGPLCSGTVSDAQGKGISGLFVEIVEPNGRVVTGRTDGEGSYSLAAPFSVPYVILFRESQTKTLLLGVQQLTPKTNQSLSLTIDSSIKSFSSAYSALQAVETLSVWITADGSHSVTSTLFKTIPPEDLLSVIDRAEKSIPQVQGEEKDRQRAYLALKARSVRALLAIASPSVFRSPR